MKVHTATAFCRLSIGHSCYAWGNIVLPGHIHGLATLDLDNKRSAPKKSAPFIILYSQRNQTEYFYLRGDTIWPVANGGRSHNATLLVGHVWIIVCIVISRCPGRVAWAKFI